MSILKAIEGWKTYICTVLIIVVAALKHYGVVDPETFKTLMTILGGLGLASLKAGQSRVEKVYKDLHRDLKQGE